LPRNPTIRRPSPPRCVDKNLADRARKAAGELMAEQRDAGKLKRGKKQGQKAIGSSGVPIQSLQKQGVDKNLADRARKAAAMTLRMRAFCRDQCALR
jgi:hypothetical protein